MNVLELFGGSCSFSKTSLNYFEDVKIFTTDIKPFENIDLVIDILDLDLDLLMKKLFKKGIDNIDVIWASPPCTYFSVASIGHHWNKDHTPKTEQAKLGVKIVQKTTDIINYLKPDFFFIENPRGKLRRLEVVKRIPRTTVCYCQYGDTRMKPTDIWTNNLKNLLNPNGWNPRKMCKNGMSCHESAPRGSSTGTQGLKGNYERSKVPYELCKEILESL